MKKFLMSLGVVLIATAAIANNGNSKSTFVDMKKLLSDEKNIVNEKIENLKVRSCTATSTVTINGAPVTFSSTITCNCSNSTACEQANQANALALQTYLAAQLNNSN
jgi:hypothetical protein